MPLARLALARQIASGEAELCFVAEGDIPEQQVNGHRLISLAAFAALPGPRFFNVAIGSPAVRARIATDCLAAGMAAFAIVAPNAVMLDANIIGEGAIFSPFSSVTSNCRIGRFFHANTYASVAHDCVIGDFVTFAPGVKCSGHVVIEDFVQVGTGALIRNGSAGKPLRIGRGAVVGMGAVVTGDVEQGTTMVGNPARLLGRA